MSLLYSASILILVLVDVLMYLRLLKQRNEVRDLLNRTSEQRDQAIAGWQEAQKLCQQAIASRDDILKTSIEATARMRKTLGT